MTLIFDSHTHLQEVDTEEIYKYLKKYPKIIMSGYSPSEIDKKLEFQKDLNGKAIQALGFHPWWIHKKNEDEVNLGLKELKKYIHDFHWLGEIGLDRSGDYKSSLSLQEKTFTDLLSIAKANKKKIILHCVKTEEEVLSHLKNNGEKWHGFVHSFHGNLDQAERFIRLGLLISIGPSVLKKKSQSFLEALKAIPKDRLLLESDYPGQTKDWKALEKVAEELALIRGSYVESLVKSSNQNFLNLTGI